MDGRIWVESEPGSGSEFHFTANFATPASARVRYPQAETMALQGLHVLVVDANASLRRIVGDTLARWHMEAAFAASVGEALDMVEERQRSGGHFDIALIDSHLPESGNLTISGPASTW